MLHVCCVVKEPRLFAFYWAVRKCARPHEQVTAGGSTSTPSARTLTLHQPCVLTWPAAACAQEGRVPDADALPSFEELQRAVGFPEYYAEEARYAVPLPAASHASRDTGAGVPSFNTVAHAMVN